MTLDLRDLTADWNTQTGEICARMVVGRDGRELLQLRVDLGVMQMFTEGRPDGQRYRGMPTALDFCRHETRLDGAELTPTDWVELERELFQMNYRRLASSSLVEDALGRGALEEARQHIGRALRDIDGCLARIRFALEQPECHLTRGTLALQPTLVFHRGRLRTQLRIIEQRYEEAVEEARRGREALEALLEELGLEEAERGEDPGVVFLRDLEQRLRQEYDIGLTLREQLEEAVEAEDFETAARLRDELRRRGEA